MNKKVKAMFLIIVIIFSLTSSCFAESKIVKLGETGITFEIDDSFEIITSSNKDEYSKEMQNAITSDKEMLVYSPQTGSFNVSYDQGKDLEKYDMSNKKSEDILSEHLDALAAVDEEYGDIWGDYEISVYDSGKYKWLKLDITSMKLVVYTSYQGQNTVTVLFNRIGFDQKTIDSVIDSYSFGTPGIWSRIKSMARKITAFGEKFLGGIGVYIVWSVIGSILLYLIGLIFSIIGALLNIGNKKNKKNKKNIKSY